MEKAKPKKVDSVGFGIAMLFLSPIINVLRTIVHAARVFFNVSFIAKAFYLFLPIGKVAIFAEIKVALAAAIEKLAPYTELVRDYFEKVLEVFTAADGFFNELDLSYRWRAESACGGGIMWLQWGAVVIFFSILLLLMGTDIMYIIVIRSHRIKRKFNFKILKVAIGGILDALSTLLFYMVQIFAFIGAQMILQGYEVSRKKTIPTCSDTDETALSVAKWAILLAMIVFGIPGVCIFAGGFGAWTRLKNIENGCQRLIVWALMGAKHLVFLTLGIWDPESLATYQIISKAELYDDDPDDDNSQQEAVIAIIAKTRGLFWTIIPGPTIFLTKVCEILNESIIFGRLAYSAPLYRRLIKWILNVIDVTEMLLIIFYPQTYVALVMLGAIVARFIFELFDGWAQAIGVIMKCCSSTSAAADAIDMQDIGGAAISVAIDAGIENLPGGGTKPTLTGTGTAADGTTTDNNNTTSSPSPSTTTNLGTSQSNATTTSGDPQEPKPLPPAQAPENNSGEPQPLPPAQVPTNNGEPQPLPPAQHLGNSGEPQPLPPAQHVAYPTQMPGQAYPYGYPPNPYPSYPNQGYPNQGYPNQPGYPQAPYPYPHDPNMNRMSANYSAVGTPLPPSDGSTLRGHESGTLNRSEPVPSYMQNAQRASVEMPPPAYVPRVVDVQPARHSMDLPPSYVNHHLQNAAQEQPGPDRDSMDLPPSYVVKKEEKAESSDESESEKSRNQESKKSERSRDRSERSSDLSASEEDELEKESSEEEESPRRNRRSRRRDSTSPESSPERRVEVQASDSD